MSNLKGWAAWAACDGCRVGPLELNLGADYQRQPGSSSWTLGQTREFDR